MVQEKVLGEKSQQANVLTDVKKWVLLYTF